MRISDLFEAPIGHLQTLDMEQPGTFPEVDRRLLQNPAHIEKIRQRFARTDVDFNLYFLNQPGKSYVQDGPNGTAFNAAWTHDLQTYAGLASPEMLRRTFKLNIAPDPEAITVVFLSNANADNAIPMTPWIIAHRFAHALSDNARRLPDEMQHALAALPSDLAASVVSGQALAIGDVLSMRSARSGKLKDDLQEELLAQYLMQGGVRFELPPKWASTPEAAALRHRLQAKAWQINKSIETLLDGCVGHIFIAV